MKNLDSLPITLVLTAAQINLVLASLADRPFGQVNETIVLIKEQGDRAIAEAREATFPVEATEASEAA